ncbi:uncharacterized protein LOC129721328 isoform X2 [Wyeomyia smithii]|uniref:uncharacterized protein LOC129721328 isoform X2 n=1 Tax=Wyeomyia smithii TaxID=174621 RepID=UPI002467F4B3|nr:uncharacterized protein LOC129721328 isoform X2 [Wyeomyia smithii]
MDTSAGSAGMSASICIKKEPNAGEESKQTEQPAGPEARIVRKVTALDPLKLKLLNQDTKNRLLTGLLAEKAKVKPPAPTTSSLTSNSTSSMTAPTSIASLKNEAASWDVANTKTSPKTENRATSAISASAPSLFRRKKVVPVAIAKKIAREEKSRYLVNNSLREAVEKTEKEERPQQLESSKETVLTPASPVLTEIGGKNTVELEKRPTAFRRIKPKVSINITQSRPKKSILKKTSANETKQIAVTLSEKAEEENRRIEEGRNDESTKEDQQPNVEIAVQIDHRSTPEGMPVSSDTVPTREPVINSGNLVEGSSTTHVGDTIEIQADMFQSQLQRMENNPSWMHNPVATSTSKEDRDRDKNVVIVETPKLDTPVLISKESVTVDIPKPDAPNASDVMPAGQVIHHPAREIRKISRLPPNLAKRLMKCVSINSSKLKEADVAKESITGKTSADDVRAHNSPTLVQISSNASNSIEQKENIRGSDMHVTAIQSALPIAEHSNDKPVVLGPTNEICRISQLPQATPTSVSAQHTETTTASKSDGKGSSANSLERFAEGSVEKPVKEIRRISHLPTGVALKLMNSLKQRSTSSKKAISGIEHCEPQIDSKVVHEPCEVRSTEARELIKPSENAVGNITTQSTLGPASSVANKTLNSASDTTMNPNRKVEILSQVILPSASYNLRELLAGKSAEKVPPGQMSFKLPIPIRNRNSTLTMPVPFIDTCKLEKTEDDGKNIVATSECEERETAKSKTEECSSEVPVEAALLNQSTGSLQENSEENLISRNIAHHKPRVDEPLTGSVVSSSTIVPGIHTISRVCNAQSPSVSFNVTYPQAEQFQPHQLHSIPSTSKTHFVPVTYHMPGYVKPNSGPSFSSAILNPQIMPTPNIVINPANSQHLDRQRRTFAPTQLVLLQASNSAVHKQSAQHVPVPHMNIIQRHQQFTTKNNQIVVPAPRLIVTPGYSQQPQQHQQQLTQQSPRSPNALCVVPTTISQKHAFQPIQRTSTMQTQHQQQCTEQQPARVIPKIVIDSSYVENDRLQAAGSNSLAQGAPEGQALQNFSPCSQAIKNKLREKLRAKMLQLETTPAPAATSSTHTDPDQQNTLSQATQPSILESPRQSASRQRVIYHPQASTQSTPVKTNRLQPTSKPIEHNAQTFCPIKQFVYGQGKKIYLTKISVTKPAHSHPSTLTQSTLNQASSSSTSIPLSLRNPTKMHQLYDDTFHGFPQSTINSELREYERFRQAMEHFERNLTPGPIASGSKNRLGQLHSTGTENAAGGETFIITELDDTAETNICRQMRQTVVKHESGMPPKITYRRKTFVLGDSDCDIEPERLPRVVDSPTAAMEKGNEDEKVKVEVKTEEPHEIGSARNSSTSDVDLKNEYFSESEPDEELARQILAIVQKERASLKIPQATRKTKTVKKRKRKHKRRRRDKDANEKLVDLLMKHVDHKSLIADIVAAQQKQISVFELSSTDEETPPKKIEEVCSVKQERDVCERQLHSPELDASSDAMLSNFEHDDSDTNIFTEILKSFVEQKSVSPSISHSYQNETLRELDEPVESQPGTSEIICSFAKSSPTKELNCDKSVSPVINPQTETVKQFTAQKAVKRKPKPLLVARAKVRKVVLHDTADNDILLNKDNVADDVSDDVVPDSSDPISDRDESVISQEISIRETKTEQSLEASFDEKRGSSKLLNHIGTVSPLIREIVNEWDSSEDINDELDQTKTVEFGKNSVDQIEDIPFRLSKEDLKQQRKQQQIDPKFLTISTSNLTEHSSDMYKASTSFTSKPISARIKAPLKPILKHRVSVPGNLQDRTMKKLVEINTPHIPVAEVTLDARQNFDSPPKTGNSETPEDSVESILKDWDSPQKTPNDSPKLLPCVLLDRNELEKYQNSSEGVNITPAKIEVKKEILKCLTSENEKQNITCYNASPDNASSEAKCEKQTSTGRVLRERRKVIATERIVIRNAKNRSNSCEQNSVKTRAENKAFSSVSSAEPHTSKLREKSVSIVENYDSTSQSQLQTPAGRVLRSRSKSVFVDKKTCASVSTTIKATEVQESTENKQRVEPKQQQEMQRMECKGHKEVEEAGGKTVVTEHKEEQRQQPIKPTPFISNRIPIPISSEDEDDASLAKRRKVLRKRRSTLRTNAARRDEPEPTSTSTYFIKTEPEDLQEYAEQSILDESFGPASQAFQEPPTALEKEFSILEDTPLDHHDGNHPVSSTEHIFVTPQPVKKRKRRTKAEIEAEREAKMLQKSLPKEAKGNRKQNKILEPPLPLNEPFEQEVICASCTQKIPTVAWPTHYAMHSGLTYRVGIDPALEFEDEAVAVQIVTRFMKSHRQLTVQCDKCGVSKKSAVGMVSHRTICGLTAEQIEKSKVTCEHCKRRMMAVSMSTHLVGHCPVLKKIKQEQALAEAKQRAAEEEENNTGVVLNQRGRAKRKATTRAEKKIQTLSYGDLIVQVTRHAVTDGCVAAWNTQFRKANKAKCVYQDCEFTGSEEEDMRQHHLSCSSISERFECKSCKYQANKTAPVMKHIKLKHADSIASQFDSSGTDAKISSESSDDEGTSGVDENHITDYSTGATTGDDDGTEKKKKSKKRSVKLGIHGRELFNEECDVYREMVLDEVIELRSLKKDMSSAAREWTLKFRRLYHSREMLFPEMRPDLDVRLFSLDAIYDYIPKCAKSLRFTMRNTNLYNAPIQVNDYMEKWQQLDTFSGQARGTDSMFYCGGPVIAIDWVPVPEGRDKHEHQILAVVCKNDFDEYRLANRTQPCKCLIQIWDLGYLNNNSLSGKAENSIPTLLYAIACDFGPVWSLKFCPSGCYNLVEDGEPYDRLGLLAATGSDGDVYIYSLSKDYHNLITNNHRIVKLCPIYRLTLSLAGNLCSEYEGHSAVRLSWTKGKKHAIIAAGHSNGTVAVWNLDSKSPLLKGTKNGLPVSFPIHRIFIPDSCITAIDLHYTEDSRYLLVCNADRKIQIYDLKTGYSPVEVCSLNARSKVTAASWNTHFPVIALTFDDVYAIDRCALTFHQPREIGVRLIPLYTITAEATDMSGNDWLSNYVIGTDGGDVLCHQPTAYVHHMAQKYNQQTKYILTSTMSVKITDEHTNTSYTMFENNFGLLFSDNDKNPQKMDLKSLQVKSYRRALLHEYPGIRVNQVRWNPNEQSHQYYAVGYQAGFVRVRGFRLK